jgi:hypothetical protein
VIGDDSARRAEFSPYFSIPNGAYDIAEEKRPWELLPQVRAKSLYNCDTVSVRLLFNGGRST